MGLRRREHRWAAAVGRGLAAARLGRGSAADRHTILTVTDDGNGNALFTTEAPHGITPVVTVTVSGTSSASYNRPVIVDAVPTPTTFLEGGGGYTGDATGGRWD